MSLENLKRAIEQANAAMRAPTPVSGPEIQKRLGRSVRREVECAHKMYLTAAGNYKCRRCLTTFELTQPTIAESVSEAVDIRRGGWG